MKNNNYMSKRSSITMIVIGYLFVNFSIAGYYIFSSLFKSSRENLLIGSVCLAVLGICLIIIGIIQLMMVISTNRRIKEKNIMQQQIDSKQINQHKESAADEIKKYKELLDMGAITQQEYDAKKKQLLGI